MRLDVMLLVVCAISVSFIGCERKPTDPAADMIRDTAERVAEDVRAEGDEQAAKTRKGIDMLAEQTRQRTDKRPSELERIADRVEAEGEALADQVEEESARDEKAIVRDAEIVADKLERSQTIQTDNER